MPPRPKTSVTASADDERIASIVIAALAAHAPASPPTREEKQSFLKFLVQNLGVFVTLVITIGGALIQAGVSQAHNQNMETSISALRDRAVTQDLLNAKLAELNARIEAILHDQQLEDDRIRRLEDLHGH